MVRMLDFIGRKHDENLPYRLIKHLVSSFSRFLRKADLDFGHRHVCLDLCFLLPTRSGIPELGTTIRTHTTDAQQITTFRRKPVSIRVQTAELSVSRPGLVHISVL